MTECIKKELSAEFGFSSNTDLSLYAQRLVLFLVELSQLPYLSSKKSNDYRTLLNRLKGYALTEQPENLSRKKLYNRLTDEPFFCTLLLIPVRESMASYYCLLAHLFLTRGVDDYRAYLAFYKSLIEPPASNLPSIETLRNSTIDEVRIALTRFSERQAVDELKQLAAYFRQKKLLRSGQKKSLLAAKNASEQMLYQSDEGTASFVEMSTEIGETTGQFFQWTPNVEKTETQSKSEYSRAKGGLKNALYNANSTCTWGSNSATPAELWRLLSAIDSAFVDDDVSKFNKESAGVMLLFFLKLMGLPEPGELILDNAGSPGYQPKIQSNTLTYHIHKGSGRIDADVCLNARLLDVAQPEVANKLVHLIANKNLKISLPHPIPLLIKASFKAVANKDRNNKTLFSALKLDEKRYRASLKLYLKSQRLDAVGLSIKGFEQTFYQYAKEQLPEIVFNFLRGKSSVQHHYVSIERATIENEFKEVWLNFLDDVGISRQSSDVDNTTFSVEQTYHDEVGSAHTLRDEVLNAMLAHCCSVLTNDLCDDLTRLNAGSLYIYLRAASLVALRPVTKPFPTLDYYDATLGVFSVSDKRVHHKDERRLIVLTNSLIKLLDAWSNAARQISIRYALHKPESVLMHLDYENRTWVHLSQSYVNQLLLNDFSENLDNRSLRHIAASHYLNHHLRNQTFTQLSLNLLMNHQRSGVSAMNQRSLTSIEALVLEQRKQLEASDTAGCNDEQVRFGLRELSDGI